MIVGGIATGPLLSYVPSGPAMSVDRYHQREAIWQTISHLSVPFRSRGLVGILCLFLCQLYILLNVQCPSLASHTFSLSFTSCWIPGKPFWIDLKTPSVDLTNKLNTANAGLAFVSEVSRTLPVLRSTREAPKVVSGRVWMTTSEVERPPLRIEAPIVSL